MYRVFQVYILLVLFSLAAAAKTTSTTQTLVWVTGTDSNGVTQTTQSPYKQKFTSMYTDVAEPSSGSIGVGTISGDIGDIRVYQRTTITQGNSGNSAAHNNLFMAVSKTTKVMITIPILTLAVVSLM